MRYRKYRYYSADFETTIFEGQTYTEVWAAAIVEIKPNVTENNVHLFKNIKDFIEYCYTLPDNPVIYFHNLKFDGTFILDYIIKHTRLKPALTKRSEVENDYEWKELKYFYNGEYSYMISDRGQWYSIKIKRNNHIIEFKDSLKLLPFKVVEIGKYFDTKHKKTNIEYKGFRYAGCDISEQEEQYIKNDVLVVAEGLQILMDEGHYKSTIGSCCLDEYKRIISKETYDRVHPNLYNMFIDKKIYGYSSVGEYILKSYKGGWCYAVPEKTKKYLYSGFTADVNSLYPSVMHSESGNVYPVGAPKTWTGDYIPDEAREKNRYYFVRFQCKFKIKDGFLPFVQIKGNWLYDGTEQLKTSDIYDPISKTYSETYIDLDGEEKSTLLTLTMNQTEYIRFLEFYDVREFKILDGMYFAAYTGLFDEYIDKYKTIKMESKGAKRTLAKLFLNNLYGKLCSTMNSSFKLAYIKDDKSIGFRTVSQYDKEPGYIAAGSAVTGYARDFTIRAAQKNYYGGYQEGFAYADTDSIHCNMSPDKIKGLTIHSDKFNCWKLESYWDYAYFLRQKTYIEHVTHENSEPVTPKHELKCAGMPVKSKKLFIMSIDGFDWEELDDCTEEELKFLKKKRDYTSLKVGLNVPGSLKPKRIDGGTILIDTPFQIR